MILIDFTFADLPPVPAARTRSTKHGHHYTPKQYKDYKKALADAIAAKYWNLVELVPPVGNPKRSKFLKYNKYCLLLNVFRVADQGDKDNYEKSVMDALGDSGVFANDKQVLSGFTTLFIDAKNPRVEIVLAKLPPDTDKVGNVIFKEMKRFLNGETA